MSQQSRLDRALRALLVLLACAGLGAGSLAAATGGAAGDRAAAVVAAARSHLGDAYAWGASGPDAFDCSGLTSTVWATTGQVRRVPRTAAQQQAWAVPIPAEQALPGDLVFFGDPVTHVGLVTGRDRTGALRMVDASASKHGVVERLVWLTGTVRYGRVPRPGMPAVRPWTPPAPKAPTAARPAPTPQAPLVDPKDPALRGRAPLAGLPRTPAPSTAAMLRFAGLVRAQAGATTWTDTGLVATLWHRAGGAAVASSRDAISARTRVVPVTDARVGDLVVYPSPAAHVGVYVGGGMMVDASRVLGKVVLRPVWTGAQLARWVR